MKYDLSHLREKLVLEIEIEFGKVLLNVALGYRLSVPQTLIATEDLQKDLLILIDKYAGHYFRVDRMDDSSHKHRVFECLFAALLDEMKVRDYMRGALKAGEIYADIHVGEELGQIH